MDGIRKTMDKLKSETDYYTTRADKLEVEAETSSKLADKYDADIRSVQKKLQVIEMKYDETYEKLSKTEVKEDEKGKEWLMAEDEVSNLNRRMLLMEDETKRKESEMAQTVMDLCKMSRNADSIFRKVKSLQTKNMTDEVLLEELDKDVKEAKFMAEDSERKYSEISRRLDMMEEELRRALERATLAEDMTVSLEEQLRVIGENMKQLEVSEEKAILRQEKYKDQINTLTNRHKDADSKADYLEKSITKLNIRIDDIEDEIVREKLKLKQLSDQLSDTFEDILTRY